MAEILRKILGEKLYFLPNDYQSYEYYPSPNQLKHKVIIKDKGKLPCFLDKKAIDPILTDLNLQDANEEIAYLEQKIHNMTERREMNTFFERYEETIRFTPRIKPNFLTFSTKDKKSTIVSTKPFLLEAEDFKKLISKESHETISKNLKQIKSEDRQPSSGLFSNELNNKTSLSNLESIKPKKNEEKNPIFQKILGLFGVKMSLENVRSVWNISSLNEEKVSKLLKEREKDIIDFHRRYLTRIFPAGKRVDSSNYDPIDAFNAGAQMIALNVQTADIPLLLYFGKFIENGGKNCGYVLKPSFFLHDSNENKYIKDFKTLNKVLNITVISGQQLRPENENHVKDVADPYVEVNLRGSAKDEAENNKVFKSIMVKNNGFNPVFNLKCSFKIFCPDLCMIVFKIFAQGGLKKDMRLGWYSIPFHCIRQGYRVIPLLNSNLKPIEFSYLFCFLEIKDVV